MRAGPGEEQWHPVELQENYSLGLESKPRRAKTSKKPQKSNLGLVLLENHRMDPRRGFLKSRDDLNPEFSCTDPTQPQLNSASPGFPPGVWGDVLWQGRVLLLEKMRIFQRICGCPSPGSIQGETWIPSSSFKPQNQFKFFFQSVRLTSSLKTNGPASEQLAINHL